MTVLPSKVSRVLAANRLGVASVVFFVVAAAGPLTTAAGGATTGFAVTGVLGVPVSYLVIALVLGLFSVGYVAMSRHISNAGAFYTYVTQGLGRIPGVSASFVALVAYNAMQIGLYGLFGSALHDLISRLFHVSVAWWVCALAGWVVIAVVGVLRVDVNGKVLAVLLIAECLVVAVYDAVFVAHPAGGVLSFDTVRPGNLVTAGWGAALAVAIAGFVGFEGSAVFAEETKDARRTVPRATFIAIAFIGVLYTVSSWALSVATGPGQVVEASRQQGPELLFNLGANYVGTVFTDVGHILFVTSVFAALLSFHNTVARYLFSLGREEVLPRGLGSTHYRTGSPYAGSLVQTTLALLVLLACIAFGIDPIVTLFFAGTSLGAFGVLLLLVATSAAVIGYFRRKPGEESSWSRVVAPALGGVLLLVVAVLVFLNFATLLMLPGTDVRSWLLPSLFLVVAAAGLAWGWYLKNNRPDVYQTIGLGPNRIIGRAVSELDDEHINEITLTHPPLFPIRGGGGGGGAGGGAGAGGGGDGGAVAVAPARTETGIIRLHNTSAEVEAVTTVLAEAFHADGPGEWLIPDSNVRASMYPAFFRIFARHALRGAGEVYTTPDRTAVAIWYPAPHGVPNSAPADYDAQLAAATGPYLPRFLALDAAMQAGHPMEKSHHYLNFIAVHPDHQGQGLGSALLAHRLGDLHRQGMPAYLEATNRRNIALYLHHGFAVVGAVRVPDGGPTLYKMWREARGG